MATLNDQQGGERRNGHRPRAETLPRADVSSAETADGLMAGARVTDVARQLGADPSTLHRWLNDPIFVAELEARRDEIVESMLDQHLLASRMATAKLMGLIDSPNEQIALRAAAILYAGGQRAYQF